jgi:hypothetical protein
LSNFEYATQLADERDYVRFRYQKPTAEQLTVVRKIVEALRDNTSNDPSAWWQRQIAVDTLHARDQALRAAESGLCFGRTDGRQPTSADWTCSARLATTVHLTRPGRPPSCVIESLPPSLANSLC